MTIVQLTAWLAFGAAVIRVLYVLNSIVTDYKALSQRQLKLASYIHKVAIASIDVDATLDYGAVVRLIEEDFPQLAPYKRDLTR